MKHVEAIILARQLRKNQTVPEKILWEQLRNRRFKDLKFSRQKPIFYIEPNNDKRYFIVDFYCHKFKTIIELDGIHHDNQKEYDLNRTDILRSYGYKLIRFRNKEIENDLSKILERIIEFINN